MANEALAREQAIRRKLRRHEIANTFAILVVVAGVVAVAAYMFARSNAWQRPARPESGSAQVMAAPVPPTPSAPVRAPLVVAAPIIVTAPASGPQPKLPPLPAVQPQPSASEGSAPRPPPQIRYSASEPTSVAETPRAEPSAMNHNSGPPAKRMLVSIKCYDEFAYERQAGGRHYFSALCLSGSRMEVSCKGASCRIEY